MMVKSKMNFLNQKAPPSWIHKPTDARTVQGSSVEIICSASGQPNPAVTWKKHQGRRNQSRDISNEDLHFPDYSQAILPIHGPVMRIEQVKNSDAGSYSCHVGNGVGQDLVAQFSLMVKGT